MVVQHNISAMTANRYYGINNSTLGKSMEKLSSGYAINRAGDNAAGLAVSEKMRAQIAGLNQASKNAQDGISMVQTYEGALQETDSILQRMRTIAVQSANGSYQNDVDRDALQLEFDQLNDELNQIADTDFNGVVALNGGVMADGTVVNDPSKVAARPNVPKIESEPDAAFTYKSVANGTVDGAGNGSLSINGVSINLTKGVGGVTLGDSASGKTTYSANVSVTDGKVNGTVSANETYVTDNMTSTLTIHGQTYSLDSNGLKDKEGNSVGAIDGLEVTYTKNSSNDITSVKLSGKYVVEDNVVSTDKSFVAKSSNKEIKAASGNNNDVSTPSVSGLGIEYNDPTNNKPHADGTLVINGTKIALNATTGNTTAVDVGGATIQATGVDATYNQSTGESSITGTITFGGAANTITAADTIKDSDGTTDKQFSATDVTATLNSGTSLAGAATNNLKFTVKDQVTGAETELTVSSADGSTLTLRGGGGTISDWNGTDIYLDKAGKVVADDDSTAITKLSLTSPIAVGTNISAANYEVKYTQTNSTVKDADAFGDDVTIYTSVTDQSQILRVDGDKGHKVVTDAATNDTVYLSNGMTVGVDGSISGTFELNDSLDTTEIGGFKIATGVSTSDSFNHGTANLTFADNMTLQVGSRSKDAVTFNFNYTTNGIGNLKSDLNASARGLGTDQVSVKNQEDANAAIDAIDNAINKVSMIRGTFGAIQNRLEHKISNIDTNAENITAAESRIRDTQMDQEMMKFTSAQILSQASQSMLAQANSLPQGVLQLLG